MEHGPVLVLGIAYKTHKSAEYKITLECGHVVQRRIEGRRLGCQSICCDDCKGEAGYSVW